MKLKNLFCLLALTSVLPAVAQYQWLDANGRRVYSDQPPPSSVPAKKVVQQPKPTPIVVNSDASKPADASQSADVPSDGKTDSIDPKAKPSVKNTPQAGKDKELEAKKKAADDAEAAKKKAEADKQNAARLDNCERAKRAKLTLDSGIRTTVMNSKGEREFMDDAARMVETKRIEGIIASDCK